MATGFERRTAPNGVTYLACAAISAPHGFSTREGGLSEGSFAGLNLGLSSGDDADIVAANRARWVEALGIDGPIFSLHQIHGPDVHVLEAEDATLPGHRKGDGIVTIAPGRAIGVFTADCAPILLEDPTTGTVAAVHAGWKGTVAGVGPNAVAAMVAVGAEAADIRAAIGPTIGPCCFEVGNEVVQAFRTERLDEAIVSHEPRDHIDLFAANAALLVRAGLRPEHVHASRVCTVCDHAYYSWRRDDAKTGRMQAAIAAPK
jgi:YfiH family protein